MFRTVVLLLGFMLSSQCLYASPQLETQTQPKFSIVPCIKGENKVNLRKYQVKNICYTVTNNTKIERTLAMNPIVAVQQRLEGSFPSGVTVPHKRCTQNFTLSHNESCVLLLRITGRQLLSGGIHGGPVLGLNRPTFSKLKTLFKVDDYLASQPSPADALDVSVDLTPPTLLSIGGYKATSFIQPPLLALSRDSGSAWCYPNSIYFNPPAPFFGRDSVLNNISCDGRTCMAVGSYEATDSIQRPLLALSTDSGNTWSYPTDITAPNSSTKPPSPSFNRDGVLNSITCDGRACMAVGFYDGTDYLQRPLLALSTNSGNTWSYPKDITAPNSSANPPDPFFGRDGVLNSITCDGRACMAVGFYDGTDYLQRPLLAFSTDSGSTWSYPKDITAPNSSANPPSPQFKDDGVLNSITCDGTTCMAVGFYDSTDYLKRSLLALSRNSGKTWGYPSDITNLNTSANPPNPQFKDNGVLNSITCDGTTCMAVGSYVATEGIQRPLLAFSEDSGKTWGYPTDITAPNSSANPPSPQFKDNGVLNSITCDGATCMTVGSYETTDGIQRIQRPLLALSRDSGKTWGYPSDITNLNTSDNPPSHPFNRDGVLNSITCDGTTCMAVGSYVATDRIQRPLLAFSEDSGKTWGYPSDITSPNTSLNPPNPEFISRGLLHAGIIVN